MSNSIESYKHKFAKNTLAQWFRDVAKNNVDEYVSIAPVSWRVNRGEPYYGVWTEYPICLDDKNYLIGMNVWDENGEDTPPAYDRVLERGFLPICIFDVAIQHKGYLAYGFEVVHRNPISEIKRRYLDRINCNIFTIDADWILSQVSRPKYLVCSQV